jgi:O-antigen/teichoic acid export membrane protein
MALMSAEEFFYGKKVLARNVLLNLLGLSLPLIIGFFSMPLILAGLGKERFGLLSLTWMILGYVSVFDLGLGRATTRYIAFALSQGEKDQIPSIFWTTVIAQFLLGLIGSLLIFSLTPIIVDKALKIPLWLSAEARTAFFLLSLVVPPVLVFGSLSGLLEVWQRFDLINAVKIPLSSINFILAALSYFWPLSIVDIVLAVFFCRLLGAGLLFFFGCRQVPELTKKNHFQKKAFSPFALLWWLDYRFQYHWSFSGLF